MNSISRPVNMHRQLKGRNVPAILDRLDLIQLAVERAETRRARSVGASENFRSCLRALCLDSVEAHFTDPDLLVGVRRDNSALCKNPAYPSFVTARPFLDALNGLIAAGYLLQVERGNEASGQSSRICSTQKLLDALSMKGFHVDDIADASPLIVLSIGPKGGKKRIPFKDTAQTKQWRENLECINANNARYALALDYDSISPIQIREHRMRQVKDNNAMDDNAQLQLVGTHQNRLHRVFNSKDWSEGGRFYGAWWQSVPRKYRQHIQINGKPTCEFDYSAMHLRLVYQAAQKPIPNSDEPFSQPYGVENREVVKRAFIVMLNAKKRPQQSSVPDFDAERLGRSWHEFLDGITEHHSGVSDYFFTGYGKKLQRLDAEIAEAVLLKFASMQYPCLPLHDSFITFATLSDELPELMEGIAKEHANLGIISREVYVTEYSGPTGLIEDDIGDILASLTKPYHS